jgi:3-isopropylmalate/(R)-2-methylmalate dehydratase large subunit
MSVFKSTPHEKESTMSNTLFENLWALHTISKVDDDNYLLAIDRCYLHDLSGTQAMFMLLKNRRRAMNRRRCIAIPDHSLSSKPGRTKNDSPISKKLMPLFSLGCTLFGIKQLGLKDPRQGIVHVVGPETGLSLPGMTIVCGDSHTCTHGAMGALSWGVGSSELYHVLATQTLQVKKPKTMNIVLTGVLKEHVGPMDVILYVIAKHGVDCGIGYAVEYSGSVISAFDMEQRLTLCNLTVELGSEYGLISPDEKTIAYSVQGEFAPKGASLERLKAHCASIATKPGSVFDTTIVVDVSTLERQVSWGITPAHTIGVTEKIPSLETLSADKERLSHTEAFSYMDVTPGAPIGGTRIQQVFIGSCSNGRLSNLREVAALVEGKRVAEGVIAWVVPGSQQVKKAAEAEGLHSIITGAGFLWGEPCCSLCGGCNGEKVPNGHRCVSTTNRNFIGRQGPGSRTHLASPYTAVKAALSGRIE